MKKELCNIFHFITYQLPRQNVRCCKKKAIAPCWSAAHNQALSEQMTFVRSNVVAQYASSLRAQVVLAFRFLKHFLQRFSQPVQHLVAIKLPFLYPSVHMTVLVNAVSPCSRTTLCFRQHFSRFATNYHLTYFWPLQVF